MSNNEIVQGLEEILADTFVLYFKTHTFHWNVEGAHFKALHDLFMAQYTELWNATDELAERIRALDSYAPLSLADMMKASSIKEVEKTMGAMEMVKTLANDNNALSTSIKPILEAAQKAGDEVTADILIGRMNVHDKAAWMLRSTAKAG